MSPFRPGATTNESPTLNQNVSIRPATIADAPAVARIYNHYIAHTFVTFEVDEVTDAEMERRMKQVLALPLPWILAEGDGEVVGYAYANRWHVRAAYKNSAETTVYLDPNHRGKGIGSELYRQLLDLVAEHGIHTVIGGIALPNDASVSLHERLGFEKAAHYREVGFKCDRWIDVGYWQRML